MQALVLASGSQYRFELLARLGLAFKTISPDIDETPIAEEPADTLAVRLAMQKAHAAQAAMPDVTGLIIASDQVASLDKPHGEQPLLGKPVTHQAACEQLSSMSGQAVKFYTALHILNGASGATYDALDVTTVTLRTLDQASIERYVTRDQPLDCAGSFKMEALGISLFESIDTRDPTALIGLPMLSVCKGLRHFGLRLP